MDRSGKARFGLSHFTPELVESGMPAMFAETFWATFLRTLAAVAVTAVPVLAAMAFLKERRRFLSASYRKRSLGMLLLFRFMLLVVRGKRKKSEFRQWIWWERIRRYNLELISEAPMAASEAVERIRRHSSAFFGYVDAYLSGPAIHELRQAARSMTLSSFPRDEEILWRSTTHPQIAEWLTSKSIGELAHWSLSLSDGDREIWISWLNSASSLTDIERAMSASSRGASDINGSEGS